MSQPIIITIDDYLTPGGAAIRVEPELEILEKAAKVSATPMSTPQVYALAALNAVRDYRKDPDSVKLLNFRGPQRGLALRSLPVREVTIRLHERTDGGVVCDCDPKLSALMAMIAGGSDVTEVHRYAMVAMLRIMQVSKESK